MDRRTVLAGLAGASAFAAAPTWASAPSESLLGYDARLRSLLNAPPGDGYLPQIETGALKELNRFRASLGVAPLARHAGLDRAARAAAADMANRNFFDHLSPEGHAPSVRVGLLARELCGASGENIAFQSGGDKAPTASSFVKQWRESPSHRANMLRPEHTHAGHGVVRVGDRTYAVSTLAQEQVRLGSEPPLRVRTEDNFAAAVANAAPHFNQFQISAPDGAAMSEVMRLDGAAALPPGAWRLRPHLATGANRYLVLWGPIFIAS